MAAQSSSNSRGELCVRKISNACASLSPSTFLARGAKINQNGRCRAVTCVSTHSAAPTASPPPMSALATACGSSRLT